MDKKDIYEHLANIYLDASSKRKRENKKNSKYLKNIFLFSAVAVVTLACIFIPGLKTRPNNLDSEVALVISSDAQKINFNFNPVKKEIYTINLNRLNLVKFKELGFSVKKLNYDDKMSLRIEFINIFKEKSEVYMKNLPHKWQDYKISFSKFKNISNWSRMLSVSFAIEEWNSQTKKGIVYIDNVRFLR